MASYGGRRQIVLRLGGRSKQEEGLEQVFRFIVQISSHETFGMKAGLSRTGGASLEIVQADITQPATLNSNLFTGASAIISATSTIVGPKEGDSEDRQKYRQVNNAAPQP